MWSGPLERRPGLVHRYRMDGRGWIGRHGFRALALLWLPAGIAAQAAVRFGPDAVAAGAPGPWLAAMAMEEVLLAPLVPCGLPLALGCRRLWRLGYRRGAWTAGIALGTATVMAALPAGLLGRVAIAVWAVALGAPVWLAWWLLAWRG